MVLVVVGSSSGSSSSFKKSPFFLRPDKNWGKIVEPSSQHKKQSTKKILSTRKYDPENKGTTWVIFHLKNKKDIAFFGAQLFVFFFVCFVFKFS